MIPSQDASQMAGAEEDFDGDTFADAEYSNHASEARQARQDIFDSFVAQAVLERVTSPQTSSREHVPGTHESIHSIMAQQRVEIVQNPRQYQMELFERAKHANTIAVLDTGSGKTLIAVLLLRWVIDNELDRRRRGEEPRLAFFLVASVTLVYQQFSVLTTNLDYEIARVCGADNAKIWSRGRWKEVFATNKIIVCTADILRGCLDHGFINMKQINLLIFDEAHHTKKSHPYARIVNDHYLVEPQGTRPRIFGMTASPIDTKGDATAAAIELEGLLDSHIATTNDVSLTNAVKKPTEHRLHYPAPSENTPETPFTKAMRQRAEGLDIISKTFERRFESARNITRDLGLWCCDIYLADALSEQHRSKYELAIEKKYNQSGRDVRREVITLDENQAKLKNIIEFVKFEQWKYINPNLNIQSKDLSGKVKQLLRFLEKEFERPTENRCIVFVQQRDTARLLTALLKKIQLPNLRCGFLIGSNGPGDYATYSFTKQVKMLLNFRKGEINCLFATSVAEEGLDVPDCNLVIRFDLYSTMIQYVQSRGRARSNNSKFIHMIQDGNSLHENIENEVRYQEREMRQFCQGLPMDRRLLGELEHLESISLEEEALRVWIEPSSGAKLTYGNSLTILAMFVSALPTNGEVPLHPFYTTSSRGLKFVAEVLLPENAPVRSVTGLVCARKGLAKRSAAFQACVLLRQKDYLDQHLMPIYTKKLPAMHNALLAAGMAKTDMYDMRTKPTIWECGRGTAPTDFWITVVEFDNGLDGPSHPIAIVTRTQMPRFSSFPLYLMNGSLSNVVLTQTETSVKIELGVLEKMTKFTLRIFADVFSKKYAPDGATANMSYWILPAIVPTPEQFSHDHRADYAKPLSCVDWALIDQVVATQEYQWTPQTPDENLINKFFVDRWDGSRKFVTTQVSSLQPSDKVPKGAAMGKWGGTILNDSVSLWKKAREAKVWTGNQPVLRAEKIVLGRNMLHMPTQKHLQTRTEAYICPEPFKISTLPPSMAISCFAWPAVIHRLEDILIAYEAIDIVGVDCEPAVALAAITKDSDRVDDEIGNELDSAQIKHQQGMGENYERLEFMGDTFLKTTTTIATFILNPNDHEFEMHCKRMVMLCNKNLYKNGVELKLYEYIRTQGFSRLWYPEGLKLLEGKDTKHSAQHSLGQKTIADVCEALIGASFISHDKPGSWKPDDWENAIQIVTKLVNSPDHAMLKWSDYRAAYKIPDYRNGDVPASLEALATKVGIEHPYRFKCPKLLKSAFVHPSQPFLVERIPNYQRLEFLGDALLDLVCVTHIFNRSPGKDPGWLTEHKMAMISNKFLGSVCVDLGFYKHLRHQNSVLQNAITAYVEEMKDAKATAGGAKDFWITVSDPPKCLADIVESFVGALFVDSDFDYNEVQRFFDLHMKPYFEDMSIYDGFANNHPCTVLHSLLRVTFGCTDYSLKFKEIPAVLDDERGDVMIAVMVHNEIIASDRSKSGRYGKARVAQKALAILQGLAPYEFREKVRCDCHLKDTGKEKIFALAGDQVDGTPAIKRQRTQTEDS